MKFLKDIDIKPGLRVFVRCDLDVPLENGVVLETFRLDAALHTLKYLLEKKTSLVIAGHLGRPEGTYNESLSTKHLKPYFDENLGSSNYSLLENLRFDPREEKNDPAFARELSEKAEVYVNECFATSHREHASIVGVPKLLPAYAGLCLEKEVTTLSKALESPQRPLVAIVGGAKAESKVPVITRFLEVCDHVLVGGKISRDIQMTPSEKLHLAADFTSDGLDIGPQAIEEFASFIKEASSVIWSGPLGVYEKGFTAGTQAVAEAVIESKAFSVIGGGDTIAVMRRIGLLDAFNFVSTGGGAMLEFLVNGTLPGLEVLN